MKMASYLLSTTTGLAFSLACTASFAQIPVTDGAHMGLSQANQMQTMAQWAQQIIEMKNQYDELQRQWEKMDEMQGLMTGARGMGTPDVGGVNSQIPGTLDGLYSGSYGDSESIMQSERVTATNANTQEALTERSFRSTAVETSLARNSYQGGIQRLNSIQGLIAKINQTKDPKAIQDLQARIQAEQAIISNESTKLQMLAKANEAERQMIAEKRQQMNRAILNPENQGMPGIK